MPQFHQGLFLSNRPDMYQIIPDDLFFWSARLSFWIASNRPHFLIGPFHQGLFWSRVYRISFLVDRPYFCKISREPACTNGRERQRLNESPRRLKRAPEGGRIKWTFRGPSDDQGDHGPTVLIGYCFSTCLKKVADHFLGTRPLGD